MFVPPALQSEVRSGIVGILLCAGQGKRFGADKLLHPLSDGTPIALAAAAPLLHACDMTVAVLRPDQQVLGNALEACGMRVVTSADAALGMGHSLAAGVRATAQASAWLVALGDMPYLRQETVAAVVSALRAGAAIVVPAYRGKRGHPVGFAAEWFTDLSSLTGDAGARSILAANPGKTRQLAVRDEGVVRDIDTVADLGLASTQNTVPTK